MFTSKESQKSSTDGKPCRACTDFKSWVKGRAAEVFSEKFDKERDSFVPPKDCPLDKDNLGHQTWSFLHTMAAYYPDHPSNQQQKEMSVFMKLFSKYYPCDHCAKDFRIEIRESPPETTSRIAFSQWLCKMHNIVNRKLGKEEFDCSLVDERWRDGWSSGVCDE